MAVFGDGLSCRLSLLASASALDIQFRPLGELAVEGTAGNAHELRSFGAVAVRLDQRFTQQPFFIFLTGETGRGELRLTGQRRLVEGVCHIRAGMCGGGRRLTV